jgi:2-keto-4-pentenoate hydratase/2-oxohepta-3-ene-1,7-dioic acid hydratase in catechol pathway
MRLATILRPGDPPAVGLLSNDQVLELRLREPGLASLPGLAAAGRLGLDRVRAWASRQPARAWRDLADVALGPAVPEPGAIYTIGLNYPQPGARAAERPERPLVYGKLPTSVVGSGALVTWDRSLTGQVDGEVELGVVIGEAAWRVAPDAAFEHVLGYTCVNDMGSRDPWLDGDQWLLGKSMAGFCPVGPWIVTADDLDPADLRLACAINGTPTQDGRTSEMRFSIAEIISFLSQHVTLRPGDLIATGTPSRLAGPLPPDRHLEAGDVMTAWIEGIGALVTRVA